MKEREASIKEVPCKLDRPLSYYEDKLAYYEGLYQKAVAEGNQEEAHKQRSNTYGQRARIRYWLSHREEAEKLIAEKEAAQAKKDAYHARAARLRELEMFVLAARSQYMQAEYEYGPNHLVTLDYKRNWRSAVADRNEFLGIKDKNKGF
jgi:hypothetical protein